MNRLTIFTAAAAAAILCTLPAFAQEQPNQNNGFVTLDLNWTQGSAPAESQLDGDTMRQMLERDEARVRMIQQRARLGEQKKDDAPKADEQKKETSPADVMLRPTTVTTPVAPPDESRNGGRTISADQMRQIVERDRARARGMAERIRAAQAEAEAEKYLEEHPVEFTPGKTPEGWLDSFTDAVAKAQKEKKPVLALFTGSDWCPPCQKLEKNILLQPAFKEFAGKYLVLLFLDYPREAKLDENLKKQNDSLAQKFSVEGYPTIHILSPDGKKSVWSTVGYAPLFLENLKKAVEGLDKDYPETAKAVKAANEAEAKAKADAQAAKEKAELEEFERQQKAAQRNAELNPWGAGRINRNIQPDPELLKELDKNGMIKGPDVLPHGGGAIRPSVKLD